MLTFTPPAALHGDALHHELTAAGLPAAGLWLDDGDLIVDGLDESDRTAAADMIDRHTPPAPPVPPDDDLAARIKAVHDDPDVPASVKKLTAALLGLNGEAAVAGRPTDR
jgi:hypothetical protein